MGKPGKKSWERDSWFELFTTAIICCFSDQLSGVPNDCFLWIIFRRSKYCLEVSSWGLLEMSGWPFHSGTNFEAYFINPHYDFILLASPITEQWIILFLFRQGCHNSNEPITVVPDTNTEQIQILWRRFDWWTKMLVLRVGIDQREIRAKLSARGTKPG